MKIISALALACWLIPYSAFCGAAGTVTVTVDTSVPGNVIPDDFTGLSIFTGTQVADHRGKPGHLFSPTNTQLITIFKNAGLHHLRIGATGSPTSGTANLDHAAIDSLFGFAKATGIKVIFSLHALDAVATAQYVWTNYHDYVDCFAFDNEPDGRALTGGSGAASANYKKFIDGWAGIAQSVVAALPDARFTGPDAAGRVLAPRFARDEKATGCLSMITQHIYVGGNPRKRKIRDAGQAIDEMLSAAWDLEKYPALNNGVCKEVAKEGFPIRLTESNDYVHGVTNASDAFASALWALDYAHWWAAHGIRGINYQNTEWIPTDSFHLDAAGNYQPAPKTYGIKMFDLGGHGRVEPVKITNSGEVNLTAYAVGDGKNLYVTVINKEHNSGARDASVEVAAPDFSAGSAEAMYLKAPEGNPQATNGITLGDAMITNDALWAGQWKTLKLEDPHHCAVTVPATSAVLVKL